MKKLVLSLIVALALPAFAQEGSGVPAVGATTERVSATSTPAVGTAASVRPTVWERITNLKTPIKQCASDIRISMATEIDQWFLHPDLKEYGGGSERPFDKYESVSFATAPAHYLTLPYISAALMTSGRWEFGAGGYFQSVEQNTYDTTTLEVVEGFDGWMVSVAPFLRWNVVSAKWIRFYVGASYSFNFVSLDDSVALDRDFSFDWGLTIGKRLYYYLETKAGFDSYISSAGFGYRF